MTALMKPVDPHEPTHPVRLDSHAAAKMDMREIFKRTSKRFPKIIAELAK